MGTRCSDLLYFENWAFHGPVSRRPLIEHFPNQRSVGPIGDLIGPLPSGRNRIVCPFGGIIVQRDHVVAVFASCGWILA